MNYCAISEVYAYIDAIKFSARKTRLASILCTVYDVRLLYNFTTQLSEEKGVVSVMGAFQMIVAIVAIALTRPNLVERGL